MADEQYDEPYDDPYDDPVGEPPAPTKKVRLWPAVLILIIAVVLVVNFVLTNQRQASEGRSFADCIAEGGTIEQCRD